VEQRFDELLNSGMRYGLQVIGAVVMFFIGWITARVPRGVVRRLPLRANAEGSLTAFDARGVKSRSRSGECTCGPRPVRLKV